MKAFDANDWIYQTWAYERHDVGTTPGFNGDTAKALASIKAKTLILTGTKDLLNPEFEPIEAGKNIPEREDDDDQPRHRHRPCRRPAARFPRMWSFSTARPAAFLDGVTDGGKKLN